MSQRTERVDELLRQEIAALLTREVADPRIGFATVTDVETTPDLRHARVWVSVIGQPEERAETLRALGRAMPYVRHQLGERLRIKRIPELHIKEDDTAERGTRVLRLLAEIEAGGLPDEDALAEELPTPVARLPHEGDAPDEDLGAAAADLLAQRSKRGRKGSGRGGAGARGAAGRGERTSPRRTGKGPSR